jgi:hypothetical protein
MDILCIRLLASMKWACKGTEWNHEYLYIVSLVAGENRLCTYACALNGSWVLLVGSGCTGA